MPINYTGGASKEIYKELIIAENNDSTLKRALEIANTKNSNSIDEAIDNIIKAVEILNMEEI